MSVVDCMMAPSRTSWRRSVRPLVRLPLWPTAKPPPSSSAEQRLDVAQDGFAGGRIAHMADRRRAGQPVDHLAAGEVIADEAHAAFGMEARAVERDDAGGFLAAMLQGVQTERRDGGGVRVSENAEHAAFFPQAVALTVIDRRSRRRLGTWSGRSSGRPFLPSAG